ncbi:MAG: hypothetical protein AB1349_14320, partial [Elusimicrobiota bacterium]
MKNKSLVFVIVLLFSIIAGITGCGRNVGNTGAEVIPSSNTPTPVSTPIFTPEPNNITPQATAVIGTSGGTLEVTDPNNPLYGTKLEIPEGALSKNTIITISENISNISLPSTDYQKVGKVIDLQPNGLNFSLPVTITLPYEQSVNLNNLLIISYDVHNSKWSIPAVIHNSNNNSVKIVTSHFSSIFSVNIKTLFKKSSDLNTGFILNNPEIGENPNAPGQDKACINNSHHGLIPGGACYGFATYSKWHFSHKVNIVHFFDAYNEETTVDIVNKAFDTQKNFLGYLERIYSVVGTGINIVPHCYDIAVYNQLIGCLLILKQPQVVNLYTSYLSGSQQIAAHSVLVYGFDFSNNDFIIYDSNAGSSNIPEGPRRIHFNGVILSDPDYSGKPYNFDI